MQFVKIHLEKNVMSMVHIILDVEEETGGRVDQAVNLFVDLDIREGAVISVVSVLLKLLLLYLTIISSLIRESNANVSDTCR